MSPAERTARALALAIQAHDGQVRKGTRIPGIAHPMSGPCSPWPAAPTSPRSSPHAGTNA